MIVNQNNLARFEGFEFDVKIAAHHFFVAEIAHELAAPWNRRDSMTDPFQSLLQALPLSATLFSPSSRYSMIETAKLETPDGETVIYLRRRFVPQPERFALLQEHVVTQGDRLDNIAAQYLGDPELFWRLCDANRALRPDELTEPEQIGRRLRITLPEGL